MHTHPDAAELGPCLPQASGQRNNWGEGASLRRGGQGGEPLSQERDTMASACLPTLVSSPDPRNKSRT